MTRDTAHLYWTTAPRTMDLDDSRELTWLNAVTNGHPGTWRLVEASPRSWLAQLSAWYATLEHVAMSTLHFMTWVQEGLVVIDRDPETPQPPEGYRGRA